MLEIDLSHSDAELRKILETSRVVAMVGEPNDHYYSSYQVYPVNPRITEVDGERSYPSLGAAYRNRSIS